MGKQWEGHSQSKFRLVDAVIFSGEFDANVIIQRPADGFAYDAEDKRRQRDQTSFPDAEVVRRCSKQHAIDNREHTG
jgi:hypothetical protein